MRIDAVTALWERGHYVSTIAKPFACDSALGIGGIPDRRALSLHTHSNGGIRSKAGLCTVMRSASDVLGELVPVLPCGPSQYETKGCGATGSA